VTPVAGATWACVICYDVTDDRRRTQLARTLAAYGRRVQYSVFEANLEPGLFDKLVSEIKSLIDARSDRVAIYRLCAACERQRLALGQAEDVWPGDQIVYVV
jgi:CRISPR-associated protein Cas2